MNSLHKTAATVATFALLLPGTALAGHGHGKHGKDGAPGQVCKSLKVKGKKTPEQRAAYKKCIHDAAAQRHGDQATTDPAGTAPAAADPAAAPAADTSPTDGKAGAPGQVCKSLKVKGKKTPEQRAAHKKCIHDAVAKRQGDKAAAGDSEPSDTTAPATPATPVAPVAPAAPAA
jgi:hypothetical protein